MSDERADATRQEESGKGGSGLLEPRTQEQAVSGSPVAAPADPQGVVVDQSVESAASFWERQAKGMKAAAIEMLDAYIEENGGDMPSNDSHPAHKLKAILSGSIGSDGEVYP